MYIPICVVQFAEVLLDEPNLSDNAKEALNDVLRKIKHPLAIEPEPPTWQKAPTHEAARS